VVDDIRKVAPEQHWKAFEQMWTGLMTYRYLNKQTPLLDAGVEKETMPLRHDMRNAHGGVMAAPLCIACPEPYLGDDEAVPAPVTASIQILDDARDVARVDVLREVLSKGKRMAFSRSTIVDAADHERVIALSAGMGVSLAAVPGGYERVRNPPIRVEDSPGMPRLHEVFGAVKGSDGLWRLPPLSREQSAPHAALHLGPIHIVLEVTAMEKAAQAAGTDRLQVESWFVMFVRPGLVGPFRAEGSAIAGRTGRIHVDLTLYDEGTSDRAISAGSAVYRAVDH
jgi:acyl-coenzyme A thioesterase PaaI-like protein